MITCSSLVAAPLSVFPPTISDTTPKEPPQNRGGSFPICVWQQAALTRPYPLFSCQIGASI